MSNITWKAFKLGDIFSFDSTNQYPLTQKQVDIVDEKDDEHNIAVIAQSSQNNGMIGYIKRDEKSSKYVFNDSMTFSMNFGICFYHYYDYLLLDTHGSIFRLIPKNNCLANSIKGMIEVNLYLAKIINKICSKSLYDWQWKPNSQRASREIILLPCIEVNSEDEYIWEENGKYYTLAVEYIKHLMDEAKKLREQKTIRLYEAERVKYEAERVKYEAGYKKEKDVLVWKGFKLGDLFERSTKLALSMNQKDLSLCEKKDEEHNIALVSASRNGSGRVGYIENSIVDKKLVSINKITFDDQWGYTYFQQEEFVITGGHNAILEVNNLKLKKVLDLNTYCYSFLSLIINNITIKSEIFGYGYKINNKFDREIILLPCIEVGKDEEYIWEENGKYYTLAVEYISYIYLDGRVRYNQKLIDKYKYQY